jgi:hypothetical protein
MAGRAEPAAEDPAAARLAATNAALERQNTTLTRLVALYDHLTGLVVQGATLAVLTRRFARLVDCPVTVLDPLLQPLAAATPDASAPGAAATDAVAAVALPWAADDPRWRPVLATLAEEQRPLRVPTLAASAAHAAWVLAPIAVSGDVLGYLAIAEPTATDGAESLALLAAQHAATVYALVLLRQRGAAELAHRLRADLVDALLLAAPADAAAARARAEALGLDPDGRYGVLVLAPAPPPAGEPGGAPATLARRRRLLDTLVEVAASLLPTAIGVARRDEALILVPERGGAAGATRPAARAARERPSPTLALGQRLVAHLAHLYPDLPVTGGVGGPCTAPGQLASAYRQARRALETAHRLGQTSAVLPFAELGIYRLLHRVDDPAELADFADGVLGALVAYDREHGAEFVRTLAVYLREHGSLQHAARELSVHVNTVSYRLQRVQTITGLDLENADDRLAAQVALKILEGT